MINGYKKMLIGFIFVTLNVNIGSVSILPDFVGYILILSGINIELERRANNELELASKFCKILILMSTISFGLDIVYFNQGYKMPLYMIWICILMIMEIIMVYNLLYGSKDLLENMNYDCLKLANMYVIISAVNLVLININLVFMASIIRIITAIIAILLKLKIISLCNKLQNESL
ncbi:MAG: hypothetical protein PUE01_10890 [Clostridiaceae bacterium]|nr:hypothetical protein [Clostridiaceae bacterium]